LAVYIAIRWNAGIPIGTGDAGDRLDNPLAGLSGVSRVLGSLSVLGRYLSLTLWPTPLSIDYSYDALGIREGFAGDFHVAIALVGCSLLAAVGWRARQRSPVVPLGLIAAAAAYAVVGNLLFPIGTIMAERLFYLPSLGLSLAAGTAVEQALANGRAVRPLLALLSIVALGYATVDFSRAVEWRSPVTIFEAAARTYPSSARAQMELASAYGREGRVQEALDRFARATAIMPEYAAAWYNRANLLAREGRFAEAEPDYERALQHAPRLVQAWYNLALVRQSLGKLPQAVAAMERAAQSAPADPQIRLALADLLLASGRLPEAISAYGAALAAGSDPVATRVNRGVALQRIHGCDAALPDYLAAVATAPTHPNARANAISCLRDLGRIAEAERLAAGRSLETKPAGR
jgi:tetratricopeptide (TPR) repeat protein